MRRGGTLVSFATRYWESLRGLRNSSKRTSPGCTGDRSATFGAVRPLVVVDDLDFVGITVPPGEADSPRVVDPDAVLSFAFPHEAFQPITGWHSKVLEGLRGVEHHELPQRHALE